MVGCNDDEAKMAAIIPVDVLRKPWRLVVELSMGLSDNLVVEAAVVGVVQVLTYSSRDRLKGE